MPTLDKLINNLSADGTNVKLQCVYDRFSISCPLYELTTAIFIKYKKYKYHRHVLQPHPESQVNHNHASRLTTAMRFGINDLYDNLRHNRSIGMTKKGLKPKKYSYTVQFAFVTLTAVKERRVGHHHRSSRFRRTDVKPPARKRTAGIAEARYIYILDGWNIHIHTSQHPRRLFFNDRVSEAFNKR